MESKNHSKSFYIVFFILTFGLFSCVSTKKYDSALSRIDELQIDSAVQANELAAANFKWTGELSDKAEIIGRQRAQIDSLKAISQQQRESLTRIIKDLRQAFPSFTNDDIHTYVDQGYVNLSLDHRVLFNRGEDDISARGKNVLKSIVNELNNIDSDIMIIGHADSIPFYSDTKDNWQLSFERAHSVMQVMIDQGLSPERIIVAGRGKNDPFISNESQIGRLLNRRIEIVLMPDLSHVKNLMADFSE